MYINNISIMIMSIVSARISDVFIYVILFHLPDIFLFSAYK